MADQNYTQQVVVIRPKPSAPMGALTIIVPPLLQTTLARPFTPINYPNPQPRKQQNQGFVAARPSFFQSQEPIPIGGTVNNQFLFKGRAHVGYVAPRPFYYTEPPPPAGAV